MEKNDRLPLVLRNKWRTSRDYKRDKRRDMDEVIRAFNAFRHACAYIPGFAAHCSKIEINLEGWRKKMSTKSWGR